MCDNPTKCFLVRHPKKWLGNFTVYTKNYHEVVQYNKDYILFPSDKNFMLAQKFEHFQYDFPKVIKYRDIQQTITLLKYF